MPNQKTQEKQLLGEEIKESVVPQKEAFTVFGFWKEVYFTKSSNFQ